MTRYHGAKFHSHSGIFRLKRLSIYYAQSKSYWIIEIVVTIRQYHFYLARNMGLTLRIV